LPRPPRRSKLAAPNVHTRQGPSCASAPL
jgi:hypothetical protein